MNIPDDGIKRRRCDARINLTPGGIVIGDAQAFYRTFLHVESITIDDNPDGAWVACYNPANGSAWLELRSDLVATGFDQTRTILDPPIIG